MPICRVCGFESAQAFKFCPECGAPVATAFVRERRKTVTVIFCDVTGSTALAESVDPEAVRALLAGYFERMKAIVEAHGGIVEKFIGDAVMAVFGVPAVHEDDALRSVRAAVEMRDAFADLGLTGRIGVNTGEVVAGTAERLATGDAVNIAARLEQAAESGEVLIGEATLRLVRDAVDVKPLEPLALKGKAKPVAAYRLLSAHEPTERLVASAMVGRDDDLAELRAALDEVVADNACRLFTIVGEAGIGKSRLVREFLAGLEVTVAAGRCLPYGEGITYAPVVEVVKRLKLKSLDEPVAAAIGALLGEQEEGVSAEQIAWAFRKTLEQSAAVRPLVVVFDDVQWGEETFLDLVEHVALLSTGAPILLICMARPELTERRSWPVALDLARLPDEAVQELIPAAFGRDLRDRITRAAGGNPLFVEEMVAMADEAKEQVVVPDTLRALLVARLEQLDPAERRVLECAAVEGEVFHRGAVQALFAEAHLTRRLAALVRQQLISPYPSQLAGEDGFRFRHLLIRDAAYESVTKASRAEMHERFAERLEAYGQDLVNLDVLVGYHLEQAHHYRAELGRTDPSLAERAGERLAAAGRRALWRDDRRAAASLLQRAADLTRPLRLEVNLEIDLATVQSDPRAAAKTLEAAAERARSEHNETGEALARAAAAWRRATFAGDFPVDELEALARRAASLLERSEDHAGLVHAWRALGSASLWQGRHEETVRAAERQIHHARLAGEPAGRMFALPAALTEGPRPVDEALRALEKALPRNPQPMPQLYRAWLLAMLGRFDDARAIALDADEQRREQTGDFGGEYVLAEIAWLEGDYEAGARYLRTQCALCEARGFVAVLSTFAPRLGHMLCKLGRHAEAEPLAQFGREVGHEQDVVTQILWRQVQALVDSHRGDHRAAETLAREAVQRSERTDALNWQGDALFDLAEVLAAAGQVGEAATVLEQTLDRYKRKHNFAMVAQVQERLTALQSEALTS